MSKQTFVANTILTAAQMNTLQANDYNQTVSTKTANYVLVASDAGTRVVMNVASANTVTVNTSLFSAGDTLVIQNIGAGVTTVTAGTATVSSAGPLTISQYGSGTLYFTSAGVSLWFPSAGPAASSGLTLITQATSTSASSLTIANCFSASYKVYLFYAYSITMGSSNIDIRLRYGTSGTPDTTAKYWFGNSVTDSGSTRYGDGAANQTSASIGANYGNQQGGSTINLTISNPYDNKTTYAQGQGVGNYATTADGMYNFDIHTQQFTTTSYTDLVIFPASSTFVVNYAIYGLAPS